MISFIHVAKISLSSEIPNSIPWNFLVLLTKDKKRQKFLLQSNCKKIVKRIWPCKHPIK